MNGEASILFFFKIAHKILYCFISTLLRSCLLSSHKHSQNVETSVSNMKQSNVCLETYRWSDSHIRSDMWPAVNLPIDEMGPWFQNPKTLKARDNLPHVMCFTLNGFQSGYDICTIKQTVRPDNENNRKQSLLCQHICKSLTRNHVNKNSRR
jgi:hypothetical protein